MSERHNRRTFLRLASGLGMLATLKPKLVAAENLMNIEDMIVINALGGISNQNLWVESQSRLQDSVGKSSIRRMRSIDMRAISDTLDSGTTAVNVTLGYVAGPEEPYEYTVDDIAEWNGIVHDNTETMLKVWTGKDILKARDENKIGVIFGFQNAESLGDRLERVTTFARLGVRIIQLTYNDANQLGHGSVVRENRGLTDFGKSAVEAMNENRILIDLSHSGENTCLDAIRTSTRPITISHTGCRALNDIPRNKTDEEMRLVAEGGGVVGIYFMPFLSADGQARARDVVRHIEHAVNVCGEDHVGIGTDGDATAIDDMAAYRQAIAVEVQQRRNAGVGAKGESSQVIPMIPDLMGPTQFRKLATLLRERRHSRTRIAKILGGNFLRLMTDTWDA